MNLVEVWTETVFNVRRHPLRSLLTALSVAWGSFAFVCLLAMVNGLEQGARSLFSRDAVNVLYLRGGVVSVPSKAPLGTTVRLTNRDIALLRREVRPMLLSAATTEPRTRVVATYGPKTQTFNLRGCEPNHQWLEKSHVVEGRFIDSLDLEQRRKVAVIGRDVRRALFSNDERALGAIISVDSIPYKVVGTFDDAGDDGEQQTIYIPLGTAQALHTGFDTVSDFTFQLPEGDLDLSRGAEHTARQVLAKRGGFSPKDLQAIQIWNRYELFERARRVLSAIRSFSWLIGVGMIFAGLVSVSNITLVSVRERTVEIGVRRALGATPSDVLFMILKETLLLTISAGYVGLFLAVAVLEGAARLLPSSDLFRDPRVDVATALSATLLLVIAGTIAGIAPARRASALFVVRALRNE